jgi:hypothetical protein
LSVILPNFPTSERREGGGGGERREEEKKKEGVTGRGEQRGGHFGYKLKQWSWCRKPLNFSRPT